MTNEQKTLLGNDWGFALLPYSFEQSITNHCSYDYTKEKIENVTDLSYLGKLGKFWKFIEGVTYLKLDNDTLIINQQKDQKEVCLVPLLKGVEKIVVNYKNGIKTFETQKSIFKNVDVCVIDFDFENSINKLELHFNFDVVEPLVINIVTKIFEPVQVDNKEELLKQLKFSHSCGHDLITIKFQNCNDDVCITKITLYDDNKQIMGMFKVDEGMFYRSITNLAYGKYYYKLSQYDKDNSLIVESDFVEFKIMPPYYGNGKMQVVN